MWFHSPDPGVAGNRNGNCLHFRYYLSLLTVTDLGETICCPTCVPILDSENVITIGYNAENTSFGI